MKDFTAIEELFEKAESGKYKEWIIKDPTVEYLANNSWDWVKFNEGERIVIHWDGNGVDYKAESERDLKSALGFTFFSESAKDMFKLLFKNKGTYLYGIYVCRAYNPHNEFCFETFELEDVKVDGAYLPREGVENVARAFGLDNAPVLGHGTLKQAVLYVKAHPGTNVVCRPSHEMQNEKGERVIVRVMYDGFKLQDET